MRILALDTSGERLIACLYAPPKMKSLSLQAAARQDLLLDRALARLFPDGELRLDAIAVGTGPGRFTGIRIGVAFAVVLGRTLEVPVAGFQGLESLATQASWEAGDSRFPFTVCAVLPAVRDEGFWGFYRVEAPGKVRRLGEDRWGRWEDLKREARQKGDEIRFAGEGGERAGFPAMRTLTGALKAETLAHRAADLFAAGKTLPAPEPYYLKPGNYERKAVRS